MATGLLGINPYNSGVNLDLSSKAAQMAIQQEQKRQAKREATEKYLMDYEKSINPAGMRHIDAQLYSKNMKDAQDYFIKNREQILNPQKYGYEAQATHLANLKDAANLVDESKTQAKLEQEMNREVFRVHSRGDELDDASTDMIHHAVNYNVRDPRHLQVNPYDLKIVKKYNEGDYIKDLYGDIKLPIYNTSKLVNGPDGSKGWQQDIKTSRLPTFQEDQANKYGIIPRILNRTEELYNTNESIKRHTDKILADKTEREQAADSYKSVMGKDATTLADLRAGLAFQMSPNGMYQQGEPKRLEPSWQEKEAIRVQDQKNMKYLAASISAAIKNQKQDTGLTPEEVGQSLKEFRTGQVFQYHPEYEPQNLSPKLAESFTVKKMIDGKTYTAEPLITLNKKDNKYYLVPPVFVEKGDDEDLGKVKTYDWNNKTDITKDMIGLVVDRDGKSKLKVNAARGVTPPAGNGTQGFKMPIGPDGKPIKKF